MFRKIKIIVLLSVPIYIILFIFIMLSNKIFSYEAYKLYLYYGYFTIASCCLMVLNLLLRGRKKYSKGGILEKWHDMTLDLMGINWKTLVFDSLDLWRDNLKILNPSANKGIYDEQLSEAFIEKGLNVEYFLFDKENIPNHVKSFKKDGVVFNYSSEKNAFDIKENLKELGVEKVNIIWDIKGCLWYSKNRTLEALKNYYEILEPGGCIIVDAMEIKLFKALMNKIISEFTMRYCGFGEVSTWKKLKKYVFGYNKDSKNEFDSMFLVSFHQLDHKHNIKVACLEKK